MVLYVNTTCRWNDVKKIRGAKGKYLRYIRRFFSFFDFVIQTVFMQFANVVCCCLFVFFVHLCVYYREWCSGPRVFHIYLYVCNVYAYIIDVYLHFKIAKKIVYRSRNKQYVLHVYCMNVCI